jgi:uncharacterized membrane protein
MRRNWLNVLLVVSLTINLILGGFLVGRLSASHAFLGGHPDPTAGLFGIVREFDPARRKQLQPLLRDHFSTLRPQIRVMRDQHRAIVAALTAEPFDAQALTVELSRTREQLMDTQIASHEALVELASQLDPTERAQLAEGMHRRGRHHGPRSRGPERRLRNRPDPAAPDAEPATPVPELQ